MRITPSEARDTLRLISTNGPWSRDFHLLYQDEVAALLEEARKHGYRTPRNANGSRARCFHSYLTRAATKAD